MLNSYQKFTDSARRNPYHQTYADQSGWKNIRLLKNARDLLELSWEELSEVSLLIGRSLRQLDIRQSTRTSVVGVLRDGTFTANPSADLVFQPVDIIAFIGSQQQRDSVKRKSRKDYFKICAN